MASPGAGDLARGMWPCQEREGGLARRRVAMVVVAHSQTRDNAVKSSGKKEVPEVKDEGSLDISPTFSLPKTKKMNKIISTVSPGKEL